MRKAIPMISALALAAAAAAAQQEPAGKQPTGQQKTGEQRAQGDKVSSARPVYTRSMEQLQQATQRLRESIQSMAQKPPGPERDRAISQAHEALFEAQKAMLALPPELRSTGTVSTAGYDESVKKLMRAADSLRESVQAMAQQPAGERRNRAIRQANSALLDTQQALVGAYAAGSTRGMGAASADKTGASSQNGKSAGPVVGAALVLLPLTMASDEKLANGCWVRFYDGKDFKGSTLTLAGPVEMPRMYPAGSVWRDWESAIVGPNARVTTYDDENFHQRTAKLAPGQRIADLRDRKLGWFDEVHSARVNCTS